MRGKALAVRLNASGAPVRHRKSPLYCVMAAVLGIPARVRNDVGRIEEFLLDSGRSPEHDTITKLIKGAQLTRQTFEEGRANVDRQWRGKAHNLIELRIGKSKRRHFAGSPSLRIIERCGSAHPPQMEIELRCPCVAPHRGLSFQAIRHSTSMGLACNGATPIAIANEISPSIRAVDFFLLGLRFPASSLDNNCVTHTHRKDRVTTMNKVALQKNLLQVAQRRRHRLHALAEFNEVILDRLLGEAGPE